MALQVIQSYTNTGRDKVANVAIVQLNAGELSPLIDARSDLEKFGSGCRRCENLIPRIYGPLERRPGTFFISKARVYTL